MKDFQTIFLISSKHANGWYESMNFQNIMQDMNSHACNDFKTLTQNDVAKRLTSKDAHARHLQAQRPISLANFMKMVQRCVEIMMHRGIATEIRHRILTQGFNCRNVR